MLRNGLLRYLLYTCPNLWCKAPLQASSKPASALKAAPFKPPSSPFEPLRSPLLEAPFKPSLEAPFTFLQAPFKPPWSPLQAPFKPPWSLPKVKPPTFKPPWSPLQAPFKPLWSPLEAFRRWSPLRPSDLRPPRPQTLQAPLKGASEGGTSEPAPAQLQEQSFWKLMLSCWQQWDAAGVPGSALSQWLVGMDVDSGPDGRNSPTYLKQNFDAQEAADLYQAVHLHTLEDLGENGPYPKVISQLALRIITYEYALEAILAIYYLSATVICQPSSPMTSGMKRSGGMVTPNLLPLSRMKQSGQMPKSYFPNWRTWWLRRNPGMGWWHGRAHRIALPPSPLTPILYSWVWCLERKSNGTSPKPCMWRQRDLGVGISCILFPGTFPSDLTKKDSRSTDLR